MHLVIGGASYAGRHVVAALGAYVNVATVELSSDLPRAMAGVEVVYLAVPLRSPAERVRRRAARAPHPLLARIVDLAVAAGVRRLVALSSTDVFGADVGTRVSERVWPRPRHPYERALLVDEEWLRTRDRPDVVVLRAAQGFGADEPVSSRLLDRLETGRLALPAGGAAERTFLAGPDLGRAVRAAAERGQPGVAYLAGGVRGSWRELAEASARELSVRVRLGAGSYDLAYLGASSGLARTRLGRAAWPTPFLVDLLTRSQLVEDGWSRRELGWRPELTTFAEGLAGLAEQRRRSVAERAARKRDTWPEARGRVIT